MRQFGYVDGFKSPVNCNIYIPITAPGGAEQVMVHAALKATKYRSLPKGSVPGSSECDSTIGRAEIHRECLWSRWKASTSETSALEIQTFTSIDFSNRA
jgi:hypothetical protein